MEEKYSYRETIGTLYEEGKVDSQVVGLLASLVDEIVYLEERVSDLEQDLEDRIG